MRSKIISTVAACLILLGMTQGSARAAEDDDRQTRLVTPRVYEELTVTQELIEKKKYNEALENLRKLEKRVHLNDYEQALVNQTLGYVYAAQENYKGATEALERALGSGALPAQSVVTIRFNLGQLYMAGKQFAKASDTFELWLAEAKNPSGSALYTVAAANYEAKRYPRTAKYVERAIGSVKSPKENWFQLQLSAYFELKNYRAAVGVLKRLVDLKPSNRNYWLQLSAMYGELNDEKRALAVIELAYRGGFLEKPDEIKNLVQRLVHQGAPRKGADIAKKELDAGRLPKTRENLELLSSALLQARDSEEAIDPLTKAAEASESGELFLRLAQVRLEREQWDQATKAAKRALDKGKLKNPGQAHLLEGIAHFNAGHQSDARRAFKRAAGFEASESSAKRWLGFLEKSASQGGGSPEETP